MALVGTGDALNPAYGAVAAGVMRLSLVARTSAFYPPPPPARVCMGFSGRDMVGDFQVGLGFGQQPEAAPEQQPPQPVYAVADDADGPHRPAPGSPVPGSRCSGRCAQVAWSNPAVMGVFHPGAIGQGQQGRHRQHQPVAGDAGRVGSPALWRKSAVRC